MRFLFSATLLAGFSTHATAATIEVSCAWARASLPHQDDAAAYLTLRSMAGDTLTSVDASEAGMVMLHQTSEKNGVSQMDDMESLSLPPGQSVALAPGGTHLMLMDMKQTLRAGETLHLSLHFAKAGTVPCAVPVRAASAIGPCG